VTPSRSCLSRMKDSINLDEPNCQSGSA